MFSICQTVLATANLQSEHSGEHCEENLNNPVPNSGVAAISCPNGSQSEVTIHPCDFDRCQQYHAPKTHNVCGQCLTNQRAVRTNLVNNHLDTVHIKLCKQCSDRQKRLHPLGTDNCTCVQDIHAGWRCRNCIDGVLAAPLFANSNARLHRLQYTHRLKDKNRKQGSKKKDSGRRFRVVENHKRRVRPACRGAGSRTIPCGKIASTARNAAKICLACDGIIIPARDA